MPNKWELLKDVPPGTIVIEQVLTIPMVVIGKSLDQRNQYVLEMNIDGIDGDSHKLTTDGRKTRVRRVKL